MFERHFAGLENYFAQLIKLMSSNLDSFKIFDDVIKKLLTSAEND